MGVKLRSAPVFYTLAQFKFNSIAQMTEYVPALQEKLRRMGYPDFRQENQMAINIRRTEAPQPEVQSSQQNRWSFTNSKGIEGYLLLRDALIFHTTEYESFETFSQKAMAGLELVHEIVDLSYIDRIGLRYLDAVCPNEGDKVEDYLAPSLAGLSLAIEGSLNHAFSETAIQVDGGTLIARSVITENGLAMPPDLVPLSLKLPQKIADISGRNAVIDIDYFVTNRVDGIDKGFIDAQMNASHEIITKAFNSSVTEHAIKTWK